jgi:hypothetical protein
MNIAKLTLLIATTVAAAITCPVIAHADDALQPCQSGQVVVSASRTTTGATHRAVVLTFELASYAPPCTLSGYPGVDTAVGGPVLHAERTLRGYMGGLPADEDALPTVALSTAEPAYAVVEGIGVDRSGNGCPTYTSLHVTPPDNTDTQNIPVTINTCELQVHPIGSTT